MKKKRKLNEYPYKAIFQGIEIKAVSMDKEDLQYLAQASADQLKSLLPKDFDFESSHDILGIAFNAYTPNLGNKNGHIISGERGIAIAKSFKGKYINIEHERQNVVGCITNYGFSSFPDDKPISEDEASLLAQEGKVFNVALSGVIWRAVNPDFADALSEAGDASSDKFGSISASWEIAFKEFNIARGVTKYLKECEIIEGDAINALKHNLKTFGGKGVDENGVPLYINLIGDTILSLGIGLTATPAADVKGITSSDNHLDHDDHEEHDDDDDNSDDDKHDDHDDDDDGLHIAMEDKEKINGNISSKNVIKKEIPINLIMKIKNINDINDDSMKTLAASAITEFITEQLTNNSEKWKKDLDQKASEAVNFQQQLEQVKSQLSATEASSQTYKTELDDLKNKIALKEGEELLQARMSFIDTEYNLSDEDRQVIMEDLKVCASEEEFQKWLKKFSVFASDKHKSVQKGNHIKEPNKIVAHDNDVINKVIEKTDVKNDLANATGGVKSLKERIITAFGGDNIQIKLNREKMLEK